jgi:hypothetical protein
MTATAVAVGEGTLLSPESHQAQVAPDLLGFGAPLEGCPACHTLDEAYTMGLASSLQVRGSCRAHCSAATVGSRRTYRQKDRYSSRHNYGEDSFDEQGNYKGGSAHQELFKAIGAYLAPDEPPPRRSSLRRWSTGP